MKPTRRYIKWTVLAAALANGLMAGAQPNSVPGPTDYDRFTQFITSHNIFDPNRYARDYSRPQRPTQQVQRSAPTFTLVGTMSYEKGLFAFFDGNQPNLRKVLYQSDSNGIAGYTVAEITLAGVTLQSADKKTVPLKIGQGMRQEGNSWLLAEQGGYFGGGGGSFGGNSGGRYRNFGGAGSGASEAPSAESSTPDTSAAPSPAIEGNDVLKRLMQQRQQEIK